MQKISKDNFNLVEINILNILNKYGKGYVVGGAVRDILLGKKPKDVDFTTNLSYETLKNLFKDCNPKEIGKSFGVLKIICANKEYEIAKFRKDLYIEKNGLKLLPEGEKIEFLDDVDEDLIRRDFTINAMAYNLENGLIDLYNGQNDIENKIINFVGLAEERIIEDPLRILRAFRFMSTLNFSLSNDTISAIKNQRNTIISLPKERIKIELDKLILGENIKNTLFLMKETGVLELIIPELKITYSYNHSNPHHSIDFFTHNVNVVEKVPNDLVLKYTALLHDIAKPLVQTFDDKGIAHYKGHDTVGSEKAKEILMSLKFPTKFINIVSELIKYHTQLYKDLTDKKLNKLLSILGYENMKRLIEHTIADNESKNIEVVKVESNLFDRLEEAVKKNMEISINDLDIDGYEIQKLGYQGKEIGEIKNKLLNLVLEEKLENKKRYLLDYILKNKLL